MSQHPGSDHLARLVDQRPAPEVAAHLAACARCRDELEALRRQTAALAALSDIEPPADGWATLAAGLETRGLLATDSPAAAGPLRGARGAGWRAAAAVALLLVGAAAGAWLRGPVEPTATVQQHADAGGLDAPPATPEQAARGVQLAEAAYLAALARYLETAEPHEIPDPVARLATLESIIVTTRAALNEAPSDPVINGYHLTALAQRDATLDQLASLLDEPWF